MLSHSRILASRGTVVPDANSLQEQITQEDFESEVN